jgi:hypothetical protein
MMSPKAVRAALPHCAAIALGALLLLFAGVAVADEIVDPSPPQTVPTQLRGMHACEDAHLVSGIQVSGNLLLCSSAFSAGSDAPRSRFVDNDSHISLGGVTLHACPPGFVVRGAHLGSNLLLCERANVDDSKVIADTSTQRAGMHACPAGMLLRGLNAERNVLACVATR